ncbi:hypothetical protein ABEB36_007484 [Hypothenemus hampei]
MDSTHQPEQFSLRWNNFHSNLKSGFHDLLQHAEMVDVTLAVDGHFLQAHKVVLSICSPYFKEMFKTNPCKHPIVILKDIGHENMKDILQFMYMGEVSVLRENLPTFLRTAETLQVKGLTGDDPSDETEPHKEQIDTDTDDQNEIYNQMIETTTDSDVTSQYTHSTPTSLQTSPLPLHYPRKQSKSLAMPSSKRLKPSEHYSSNYNLKTNSENDTPKPNVDYKSCDFVTTQMKDIKTEVVDNEEAKDYSKSGTNQWKNSAFTIGGVQNDTPVGTSSSGTDQTSAEQVKTEPKSATFKHGYQCEQCLKRFSRRDHLRTHEKNIHGSDAGPFKCMICEQLYKNTESLRKHISKFHCTNLNDLVHKVEVKA